MPAAKKETVTEASETAAVKEVKEVKKAKPAVKSKKVQFCATGRRKSAIARVRLLPAGSGTMIINRLTIDDYLQTEVLKLVARQPLALTQTETKYDIMVNVEGGGLSGQAGAICHGIARALCLAEPNLHKELKAAGLLTRDSRSKERKKYGLKKARRAPQFSKR